MSDRRVRRSATLTLDGPFEKVFPLFDPINEAKWADGWAITPVWPADGRVEVGMVFTTPAGHAQRAVWMLARLDAEAGAVAYWVWFPDERVQHVEIACRAAGPRRTEAQVSYTLTALGEAGQRAVAAFDAAGYARRMAHWEEAINHHLATGQTLRAHAD